VRAATEAERSFLEGLGGGCAAPIAAHATVDGDGADAPLRIEGRVAALDGRTVIRISAVGGAGDARQVGLQLAADARIRGADALL
jgi:hydroxymethylbilane synthase